MEISVLVWVLIAVALFVLLTISVSIAIETLDEVRRDGRKRSMWDDYGHGEGEDE